MTTKNLSKNLCRSNQKSGRRSRPASKQSANKPGFLKAKRPARGESASKPCNRGSKGGGLLAGFTCKQSSASLKNRPSGGNRSVLRLSGPVAHVKLRLPAKMAALVEKFARRNGIAFSHVIELSASLALGFEGKRTLAIRERLALNCGQTQASLA